MIIKNVMTIGLIGLFVGGCVSSKSYVDPKYSDTSYTKIRKVEKQYDVKIEIEFQRNGKHLAAVDNELRSNVERVFRASGVVVPSATESNISIKITCNNIADIAAARAKGFGTGLTFGTAGTAVTDFYNITIEFRKGDEVVVKSYDHALYTTIGNKAPPVQGVEPTSAGNAFSGVLEDVILQFLKDMQDKNILTLHDLFDQNRHNKRMNITAARYTP